MITANHPVLVEAKLREAVEPLQIDYPVNYTGMKSNPGAAAIFIGTTPAYYYESELEIVAIAVASIGTYAQGVIKTGAVRTFDDPLSEVTNHDIIDGIEIGNNLPLTRSLADGTDRSIRDRIALVREHGYRGGLPEVVKADSPVPAMKAAMPSDEKKSVSAKKIEASA